MDTHSACGRKVTPCPMSSPDFAETLRQLKLDLAKGTPVSLRINAAGSRLTRLTPRPQDPSTANGNCRYPKYDSLKATRSQLELELANAFPTPFSSFFSAIYHASRRPNAPPRPTTYRDGSGTKFFDPFSHLAQAERLDKTTDTARWLKHLASRAAAAEGRRRLATRHPDGEGNLRAVSAYCQLDRAGKRAYLTLRLYFNRVDAEETRLNNQLYHMPPSHPRRSCIRAAFVVAEADPPRPSEVRSVHRRPISPASPAESQSNFCRCSVRSTASACTPASTLKSDTPALVSDSTLHRSLSIGCRLGHVLLR